MSTILSFIAYINLNISSSNFYVSLYILKVDINFKYSILQEESHKPVVVVFKYYYHR